MNKKQWCLFKRFAALVAALVISLSFPVSALAASDTEADMPSKADFLSHRGSWFVWRTRSLYNSSYYELCASPLFFDSSGNFDTSSYVHSYKSPSYFDVSVISGSDEYYYYACSLPVPLVGLTGFWSELPSFPVGFSGAVNTACLLSLYSDSSWVDSDSFVFLTPCFSSASYSVFSSNSIDSSTDSITVSQFPTPLYSFPFAFRSGSSSHRTSYKVQGGKNSCISFSKNQNLHICFDSTRFLIGPDNFSQYPFTCSFPSSDIGLVAIKNASPPSGGTLNSASSFAPSSFFYLVPTLLVPVGMLPDSKLGDWISDSPENLQDAITNEFGVDSGRLKDSKDSLNSWNSSSSVDTDIANTSLSTINALFQNLGQFLAIVSLMIFGAVMLRMLLRKAVDG